MDGIDVVVHFAAKSNVDRSISGPTVSIATNVVGTGVLIEAARRHSVPRFIHVSTDEVYGSVGEGFAEEDSALNPRHRTPPQRLRQISREVVRHNLRVHGDHHWSTNNFGPYQFPEKVIPLFVTNLVRNQRVPVYGDGHNERDWLYVEDHCRAIHLLVDEGVAGDIYNIGANNQMSNLDLTCRILAELARDESMIEHVADRPGHDDRYAVNSTKIRRLGWAPEQSFDEYLSQTVTWYQQHRSWWGAITRRSRRGLEQAAHDQREPADANGEQEFFSLLRPEPRQHRPHGSKQNLQVEPDRHVFHVVEVEGKFLDDVGEVVGVSVVHLGPARHPGADQCAV